MSNWLNYTAQKYPGSDVALSHWLCCSLFIQNHHQRWSVSTKKKHGKWMQKSFEAYLKPSEASEWRWIEYEDFFNELNNFLTLIGFCKKTAHSRVDISLERLNIKWTFTSSSIRVQISKNFIERFCFRGKFQLQT